VALLGKRLAVAIPDTLLEGRDSSREKTTKLGLVARVCSIYGVDLIQIFRDPGGRGEEKLIRKVLEYLETPQYLRRRLYPMDEALRFAGLLPPLRIPSHKPRVTFDQIRAGEAREGVTNPDGTVDVGLERAFLLEGNPGPNRRVTVRLSSLNPPSAKVIGRTEVGEYWGYAVETAELEDALADRRFRLKIATSRLGDSLESQISNLKAAIQKADSVLLLFGSPSRGLFDIAGREISKKVDFLVNLFVEQHVKTVRAEEALAAGLNLVSNLLV
jgi:methyltransferase